MQVIKRTCSHFFCLLPEVLWKKLFLKSITLSDLRIVLLCQNFMLQTLRRQDRFTAENCYLISDSQFKNSTLFRVLNILSSVTAKQKTARARPRCCYYQQNITPVEILLPLPLLFSLRNTVICYRPAETSFHQAE